MNPSLLSTPVRNVLLAPRVLRHLRPSVHIDHAACVDEGFLRTRRIRAVIWDVDGTLMGYHRDEVDPALLERLTPVLHGTEWRNAILSNCSERRYVELSAIFPHIPIIRAYAVPDGTVTRHRRGPEDTMSPAELDALVARGGRVIRKPDRRLVEHAMTILGIDEPAAILMVGDQYFTDVATGNFAGVQSAKVPTLRPETFPPRLRFGQAVERTVYRLFHGVPAAEDQKMV